MPSNENPTVARFNELFGRLLATVAEQHVLESRNEMSVRRIDVRNRLHALRSDLAIVRDRLTRETVPHPGDNPRFAI
jgi:hypothetical protein